MKKRILLLGAGFGGLELTTLLSESLGVSVETTLIDRNDAFVFGYSKLDVMWHVRGTIRAPSRGEGAIRLQPAGSLVRRRSGRLTTYRRPTR